MNQATFFNGEFSCTPDAVLMNNNHLKAVAEFKSANPRKFLEGAQNCPSQATASTATKKANPHNTDNELIWAAKRQLSVAMHITGVNAMYCIRLKSGEFKIGTCDKNPDIIQTLKERHVSFTEFISKYDDHAL